MHAALGSDYFSLADLPNESWLPLSRWKGHDLKQVYQVSNKGRFKKEDGQIIPGSIDPCGYHVIHLQFADPNVTKNTFAHSLVLTVFRGGPPPSMAVPTVQHIDHSKINNCIDNLEWMEMVSNSRDAQAMKVKIQDNGITYLFDSKEDASK